MSVDDDKRKTRKNIGLGLLALGLGGPLALQGHNILKVLKAKKLMKVDALKSTGAIDSYIKKHLAATGRKLPKYRWQTLKDVKDSGELGIGYIDPEEEILAYNNRVRSSNKRWAGVFAPTPEKPLPSSLTIPVYRNAEDLAKGLDMLYEKQNAKGVVASIVKFITKALRRGGHFDPELGYVSLGNSGLSPKILLHELGHAQDAINGKLKASDRSMSFKSLGEWWDAIRNPDASKMLQTEIRAWDNGGIKAGDRLREAALDTYRSAVRAKAIAPVFLPAQVGGGYMYAKNRDPKKK